MVERFETLDGTEWHEYENHRCCTKIVTSPGWQSRSISGPSIVGTISQPCTIATLHWRETIVGAHECPEWLKCEVIEVLLWWLEIISLQSGEGDVDMLFFYSLLNIFHFLSLRSPSIDTAFVRRASVLSLATRSWAGFPQLFPDWVAVSIVKNLGSLLSDVWMWLLLFSSTSFQCQGLSRMALAQGPSPSPLRLC